MTSLEIFISWFKEYYRHEYFELPVDYKNFWIEEILKNNGQYITKEMVTDFDNCAQCGECCKNQRCPDWDSETKLCTRHDDPIHEFCREYPWGGEFGIAPLTLNCVYMTSFFVNFFNAFFEKQIKNGENCE